MSKQLKPCPFCGSKGVIIQSLGKPFNEKKRYHPCCDNKNCIMFTGCIWYDTEKEAAEAWNRRPE